MLEYSEFEKPVPGPGEVLVIVRYASVTSGDTKLRKFNRALPAVTGLVSVFKPMKISGMGFAGTIEEAHSYVDT